MLPGGQFVLSEHPDGAVVVGVVAEDVGGFVVSVTVEHLCTQYRSATCPFWPYTTTHNCALVS